MLVAIILLENKRVAVNIIGIKVTGERKSSDFCLFKAVIMSNTQAYDFTKKSS